MEQLKQYERAEELERHLGDPLDASSALSFARAVALDEGEQFPEEAVAALDRRGMQAEYVPAESGGRLQSFEQFLSLVRVLARRDYTVAVAHVKTYLGAVSVWMSGSEEQRERLAGLVLGGEPVALALTEREHGADVLSNEVTASRVEGGYLLSGEKWLINNATRGTAMTVYAKTDPRGGPRGYSLFLVEKRSLDPSTFAHLPKIRTHGIRGADVGGIRFENCFVPEGALVGAAGGGLETLLKGFQITRTLIAGLSLGAGDTALRAAVAFATTRELYGGRVSDIPYVRSQLAGAFVDLLACDCVALSAARALHAAPAQMSVWSAVAKYFVPVRVEALVREMAVVLGARHYLREGHFAGVFQKLMRDNAVASLFDGSTVINLNAIIQQLKQLYEYRAKTGAHAADDARARAEIIFDLGRELPKFDREGLALSARGRDDLLGGLEEAVALAHTLRADGTLDAETLEAVTSLAARLLEESRELERRVLRRAGAYANAFGQPAELFELAKRHCTLAAAAVSLRVWLHNRGRAGGFFASGAWLALALQRLLKTLRPDAATLPQGYADRCVAELLRLYEEDRMFSVVPLRLAGSKETRAAAYE